MQQPGLRSSNLLWNNWSWLRLPQKTQKQTEMPPRLLEKKNTSSVAINTDGHVRSSPAAEVNNEHIMWTRHVTFGTNINRWVDCWRDIPTTRLHSGGGELNSLLSTSTFISFSNYVDSSHIAAVCRSDFQQLSKATQDFIDLFLSPDLDWRKTAEFFFNCTDMKAENTEAYLKTKTICSGRKYLLVIRMNGAVKPAVGRLKLRSHTENTAGWLTNNTTLTFYK